MKEITTKLRVFETTSHEASKSVGMQLPPVLVQVNPPCLTGPKLRIVLLSPHKLREGQGNLSRLTQPFSSLLGPGQPG